MTELYDWHREGVFSPSDFNSAGVIALGEEVEAVTTDLTRMGMPEREAFLTAMASTVNYEVITTVVTAIFDEIGGEERMETLTYDEVDAIVQAVRLMLKEITTDK